jgi:hypothetical protein
VPADAGARGSKERDSVHRREGKGTFGKFSDSAEAVAAGVPARVWNKSAREIVSMLAI